MATECPDMERIKQNAYIIYFLELYHRHLFVHVYVWRESIIMDKYMYKVLENHL